MVGFRRRGTGLGVALAAALLFVLQTAVGAMAIGQGQPPLDIFGNPLCITSATGHTAPAKGDHPSLPECCTLGCSMASPAAATPPQGAVLAMERPQGPSVQINPLRRDPPADAKHDPGNPRAPPPAA